jgi:capsular exopolysaccharide synthesis family protein
MAKKRRQRKGLTLLNKSIGSNNQFDYSEVYRHIRTNIEFSNVDKDIHSISITSTQPYEAKTTTALNLAIIFAMKYARVLIIDCDLRKPQVHGYLKLSNQVGLTNALKDYSKTRDIDPQYFKTVKNDSFIGTLTVLTAGTKVPNPNELLSSEAFKAFISDLNDEFDFIIIDCPPISSVSDAIPVANSVDGTVFICSCQDTNRKDALSAISTLKQSQVNIIGTILTKAETYKGRYGYGYGYGYKY